MYGIKQDLVSWQSQMFPTHRMFESPRSLGQPCLKIIATHFWDLTCQLAQSKSNPSMCYLFSYNNSFVILLLCLLLTSIRCKVLPIYVVIASVLLLPAFYVNCIALFSGKLSFFMIVLSLILLQVCYLVKMMLEL